MHAAFVFQLAVRAAALDGRDDFLEPADAGVARRHQLEPPALALGVLAVHPEQLGGEERRLVAARAGADFEDDVLFVVRILGIEQDLELGEQRVAAGDERLQLLLRELAHVGIGRGGELLRLREVARDDLVFAEALDERLDLGRGLGELPVLGRIALDLGRPEVGHQLVVSPFN